MGLICAGSGLLLGLTAGVGIGFAIASADFGGNDRIPTAVELCEAKNELGVEIGDDGRSLTIDTSGEDYLDDGTDYETMGCLLGALDAPDSMLSRMENTRALDGRLSADWDGLHATWGYHPDTGMDIVIETLE